jgi:heme oxygenase
MQALPTDVLTLLRSTTAARHAQLDAAMPLARPAADLRDYAAHLRLLRPWLATWEDWLLDPRQGQGGPFACAALPPVRRTALIDADLQLLPPATPAAATADAAPSVPPLPAAAAWRWGVAYVIEGAQLGAQVLARRLGAQLAPHPLAALRQSQPRWPVFVPALRAAVQSPADQALAAAGACAAFDSLLQRLPANVTAQAGAGVKSQAASGARA